MKWLTIALQLLEAGVSLYKRVVKQKKKEDLKDEVRKRDDKHTVDSLRDIL